MARKREALNVAEAKRELSSLLARVAFGGESITIMRRGRPMAKLVPIVPEEGGLADVKGWLEDGDPFFAALEDREAKRAQPARVLSRARSKR